MQLNQEFAPVMKSSNKLETNQATIAMTAHMFQVLSAAIYQHPERAVIRELSCNALDGHVAAGNYDKPFKVHLPNQLEPWFEVRDFGTGMTHEQVMKLYLTYGASTKRDSNDLIGGLGIGSKSPFAVAQSFTVTSYVDGVVRRYSIYMEEGIPQVTKLTESATTEPNGVAVRVAIPMDKISVFEREANRIYTHFPVKPDCNKPLTGLYEGMSVLAEEKDDFKIFSGSNQSSTISLSIVMGNIEYPIKINEVVDDLDTVVPQFLVRSIQHALIYLPIGSVNIAASRESLQLTDATKQSIIEVFKRVAESILSSFQSKIDAATNLYEAIEAFYDALGKQQATASLMAHITFQGKSMLEWRDEQDKIRMRVVTDANGDVVKDWHGKPKMENRFEPIPGTSLYRLSHSTKVRPEISNYNAASSFSLFGDMGRGLLLQHVFAIDDRFQKNGARKAVGKADIMREISNVIYKERGDRNGNLFIFDDQKCIDELCALHHYPKDKVRVVKLSTYEYAYEPKKAVRGQVKLWEAYNGNFREVKVDLDSYDEPQYYIRAEGQEMSSDTLNNGLDLKYIVELLTKFVSTKHVFMFRKTVWNKVPEDWIEITDKVIEQFVKEHPEMYIELNRQTMSSLVQQHKYRRPVLSTLNVRANLTFNGRTRTDGHVETDRNTGLPLPSGVNFEDNLEVFHAVYGRPQVIFADIFYGYSAYEVGTSLRKVVDILPKKSKLRSKIKKATTRAEQVVHRERKIYQEKNKLISWIDWGKVNFRKFCEHQGYKLTPYVNK